MSEPDHVADDTSPENVEELRVQIDHTREELADTVQALAAKADVKGRAKAKAQDTREQAQVKAQQVAGQAQVRAQQVVGQAQEQFRTATADRPWLVPAAGASGLVALLLAGWLALRRRQH